MDEDQIIQVKTNRFTRSFAAHLLMCLFVFACSLGVSFIYPPAGLIVLGVTSGIYGLLLGAN